MDKRKRIRCVDYYIYHKGQELNLDDCEVEIVVVEDFIDGDKRCESEKVSARNYFKRVEILGHKFMMILNEVKNGK